MNVHGAAGALKSPRVGLPDPFELVVARMALAAAQAGKTSTSDIVALGSSEGAVRVRVTVKLLRGGK